jgi:Ca2+-binding EF-hand superfamily protein
MFSTGNKDILNALFRIADANNDGVINWEEFLKINSIIQAGDYTRKIALFFQIYDTDGNGHLSFGEIEKIF